MNDQATLDRINALSAPLARRCRKQPAGVKAADLKPVRARRRIQTEMDLDRRYSLRPGLTPDRTPILRLYGDDVVPHTEPELGQGVLF